MKKRAIIGSLFFLAMPLHSAYAVGLGLPISIKPAIVINNYCLSLRDRLDQINEELEGLDCFDVDADRCEVLIDEQGRIMAQLSVAPCNRIHRPPVIY